MNDLSLAVIIPAYETPEYILKKTLNSVLKEATPSLELIVVDSSPSPVSGSFQKAFPNVVFHLPGRRMYCGEARNVGVEMSKSKWLSFLDSDCCWSDEWLVRATALAKNPQRALAYCGPIEYESPARSFAFALHLKEFHEFTGTNFSSSRFLPGGNVLIRREDFERVGGYESEWASCEDIGFLSKFAPSLLNDRPIYFDPKLAITHQDRKMTKGEIKRKLYQMGYWRAQYDKKLPRHFQIGDRKWLFGTVKILAPVFFLLIVFRMIKKRSRHLKYLVVLPDILLLAVYHWAKGFCVGIVISRE